MSMKQFMVRVIRDTDEEYADVVVDSATEDEAKELSLKIVEKDPYSWFPDLRKPSFYVDPSSDIEELDGLEYRSANL